MFPKLLNPDERQVRVIWILNVLPYLGLGYLYAVGSKGLKPVLMFFVIECVFGPHLPFGLFICLHFSIYVLLSLAGTFQLMAMRSPAKRLEASKQIYFDKRLNPPPPVTESQTPLAGAQEEFALPTLEQKAKRAERALKKLSSESIDKSKYAVESFEYKAQAAENALSSRGDQAGQIASASDSNSADRESEDYREVMNEAPEVVPENQPFFTNAEMIESQKLVDRDDNAQTDFSAINSSVNQTPENKPFFSAAEVADAQKFDDAKSFDGNSINDTPENKPFFSTAEVAGAKSFDDKPVNQEPENKPFFSATEVANAKDLDRYDRSIRNEDLSSELSQQMNFEMPKNEMALPSANALDIELPASDPLPELAPELRIPIPNGTPGGNGASASSSMTEFIPASPDTAFSAVPDITIPADASNAVSDVATPENLMPTVGSPPALWPGSVPPTPSTTASVLPTNQSLGSVPELVTNPDPSISFGNFESPKFEFSFEDHLSTSFDGSSSAGESVKCPKCGAARNSSFSFCLSCGHSYDENAST